MQKDSTNVCASDQKDFDRGIIGEKLESMKKSRSGFLSNVTRLEGELDVLLQDVSNYQEASDKKGALDGAFTKCLEFCKRYISEVPFTEHYQAEKEEAEAKFANLQRRKFISDQKYEQYVQLCTDKEGSASDMCSVESKRSSASLARKHEIIALQWKEKELSLELERARAVARIELLKLKDAMSTSASSRSKRKQLRQCDTATNLSGGEPCCSKDVTKGVPSLSLGNAASTRAETNTSQPVTSKFYVVDAKPKLNVTAKDFVPKQRVFINRDETLSASHPYVNAQSLPVGPVPPPLSNANTNVVQSNSIALETIKGLSTAIREGIALPKRNLPTFDGNPLHYYGFLKSFEETVMKQVSDPASQLAYLIDMCRDKAYEAIRSCNIV